MKQKIQICVLFLCLAIFCGGCQETPKEVQQRMENYGENKQIASEEISYCTVEELRKTTRSDINVELDNMTLPDKLDFSGMEGIALLKLSFEEKDLENRENILDLFRIDEKSLQSDENTKIGRQVVYDSATDKKYLAMVENGFVSYVSGVSYDYIYEKVQHKNILEKYDLDLDDISKEHVEFQDGKAGIAEVRDLAEDWLEKHMPIAQCNYIVSDAYVRELETSEGSRKQLSFHVEVSYQGMRFNSYANEVAIGASQVEVASYGIQLNYDNRDQMSFFSNSVGRLKIDSAEKVSEIVDLESAIRLVNREVSGFHQLKIDKVLPLYALYPKYNTEKELISFPGQKVEGRPVYAFIIIDGEENAEFGINKENACKVIFVDMVTGEVWTNIG